MSEDLLVRHCSPTLAGLKPGSMFSSSYETEEELTDYISRLNQVLVPKGLHVILLRKQHGKALIYVFRPRAVQKALQDDVAAGLLKRCGYRDLQLESCICRLMGRLHQNQEFPHEVGLFLGYPPEDVCAFIENHAGNHKCVGTWKVYGDEDAAKRTFARYRKCTDAYCNQWAKGQTIEQLAVAGS